MQTIHLSARQLQGALLAASKDDIPYYLNGVLIESANGCTRVCGTNGHILYIHDFQHDEEQPEVSFILPRAALDTLKPKNGKYDDLVTLEFEEFGTPEHPRYRGTLRQLSTAVMFDDIEGRFPDYTSVIPSSCTHERAVYGGQYLTVASKIAAIWSIKFPNPVIRTNGNDAAVCTFPGLVGQHTALMVMMPVRTEEGDWWSTTNADQFRSRLYVEEKKPEVEEEKQD